MIPVKIKVRDGARVPEYKSSGSAGADICAFLDDTMVIGKGETALIPTGLYIEIPPGYEAQIRPRSGLALKHGITLLNTPGTIDSDYRGEISIIMANLGKEPFTVENGMRIAQMVFSKVYSAHFLHVDTLTETIRNDGGFGHTGL
ncbi:MAG TPA: dUTP diphosphatase [Spirochaetota bacterium]|nr:dUTP diphosphatase [Spirochaetota bacterium]HPJ39290.1 dUTP diphosphatase [Spirochaetota bacterium]